MCIGSVFGAISVFALVGCSGSSDAAAGTSNASKPSIAEAALPQTAASAIPQDSLSLAVKANNALAVDLYAHLLADTPSGNLLTSPISASLALTMTYAGAVGSTATEMAQALHFDPSVGSAIFDGQNALSQALAARGPSALARAQQDAQYGDQPAPVSTDYDLHIINSVWGEKTYTWEQPFLATLAQSYGTGVYQEDFINAFEPARLAINNWVSDQTKDKINNLLPDGSLDTDTRMVLVNAMHLKFPWASPFSPSDTMSAPFTLGDGSTVSASFMNESEGFPYVDDGQAQIVALPLSNREVSLVIALPHAGVDLATYEASLNASSAALSAPSTSSLVALSLPKATFTSPSFSLTNALKAMGMMSAFDKSAADFSGLCAHPPDNDRLYVSDVLQKAMISMQETGIEAAAATAVAISGATSSGPGPEPVIVPMVVNRPYLVALVDGPTGAILMLGHVTDPTDAGSP
jgi:serpin B